MECQLQDQAEKICLALTFDIDTCHSVNEGMHRRCSQDIKKMKNRTRRLVMLLVQVHVSLRNRLKKCVPASPDCNKQFVDCYQDAPYDTQLTVKNFRYGPAHIFSVES